MSEKFSPSKFSESVDNTASRALKGLRVPNNIPRAPIDPEEASALVLQKAAQIRERARQLAEGPRDAYEEDIQRRVEARIKENEKRTKIFQANEKASKITARAKQVMENPRNEYEEDIKRRVEAKRLESKNKARVNKAKDMAARITRRAQQVMENPRNEYEEDIKRRVEAKRAYNSQPLSEKQKLAHAQSEDKVLFDLDGDVASYENEGVPLKGRLDIAKTQKVNMNEVFADDVASYENEGVPLKGRLDIDKTQEIDMNEVFANEKRNEVREPKKIVTKNENRAYINRPVIEEKQRVLGAARNAIRELGFEPREASLILDEDFVSRLKKRGYTGSEASVLASIAKEKANDLRSYFKVMGVSIDRYGEPDLGFLKKLGGLFGGYNKKVMEIKQSEDFKRMKLLDMLALDADEVLSAPRRNPSSFGKKAVLVGAAAAAIGGAMMKGKGQPDSFSSRAVASQSMGPSAEKVAPVQREEIPEYDFTESEAGYDEDFDNMKEKEFPQYAKLSVPAEVSVAEKMRVPEKKVEYKKNARRDADRFVEKAAYSEKAMSNEVKMNMLEDFFESKEFKNLPKDIRQKMIYALAGSSIVSEPEAFSESLAKLKKSISKLPGANQKLSPEERGQLLKGVMSQVDSVTKRK